MYRRQSEPLPLPQFSRSPPELQRSFQLFNRRQNIAMPHSQILSLEVTQTLCERAKSAFFEFGEDTALVAVQHMLEQTIDLFETITDLGVSPQNIFALGKVYSNSRPVIETLRNRGVTVVESTTPGPGRFDEYFEQDAKKLWQVAGEKLAGR